MHATMATEATAAEWWMVAISAAAAIATAIAAAMAVRSANAAKATAQILRDEREEAVRARMGAPLIDLRSLLAEYTVAIAPGEEGGQFGKAIQRQVKATLEREALASRLPKCAAFANATKDEVALAEVAFHEVADAISKTIDEGAAFGFRS